LDHRHGETAPEALALIRGEQVDGVQFAAIESIATALGASRGKPDDLSGVLRGNVHTARGGRGREDVTPELLASHIREIGKRVSGYDTGIGGAPTVDVHPGDGGSIDWGSLTDEHRGTKPLTL
jgi:hypothetical protein